MSNPDSDKSNEKSGIDPRLKSFLRQARAVIAAERGLNPRSQLKLQSLAHSMKLPDELFQTAIDELKHAQKPTEVALWERAFVDFLDKEFKKLPDHIVSIRMEARAVDLARRKYQLSDVRARQLIAQRAEALGLGQIAPAEAKQYVKKLIVDRIGDATALDDETREQLYQSGHTWGLERSFVDELVLDQLIRNRGVGRSRAGAWLVLFLITVGALGYAGYKFSWLEKIKQLVTNQSEIVVSADPVVDPDPPPSSLRVAWWSEEFQAEVELRKEKQPDLRIALSKLAQPEAGQRIIGFQNLIDLIMNSNDSKTGQWEELFFELFILEPDLLTTNTTLDYLGRWLSPGSTEGLVSLNRLQSAYYANRLFTQLAFFEPATPHKNLMKRRTDALAKQSATLGMTITNGNDADARGRETESAVASEQWNYVVQNCWSAPARCAIVIQPLYELTKDKLDRTLLNQFRIRAIESILDVDQSRWKDLTEAIAQAIEVADEIRVNNWIRYFQTVEDREFGDFLGQLLIKKTGISPATNRLSEIKRLLSEVRMSYQNRLFQPILERNQRVEKYSSQAQQATKLHPTDVQPELIARIAFAANVSLAMANAAQRDDQLFDDVDELLNNGNPVLNQIVPLGEDSETKQGPATTTPSASENRQKKELVAKLSRFKTMSSVSRQTAIEQLSRIAGRFEQISYPEAVVIADYILSSMPLNEWLIVEKNLSTLKKWPNLALAIADRLPRSTADLDQALTIYRLMFDDETTLSGASDWKTEIAKRIYVSTLEKMQRTVANDFSARQLNWKRLKIFLARFHEARHQLIRAHLGPQNQSVARASFGKNSIWSLRSLELLMNDRKTGRMESEQISRLSELIIQDGPNELEQTVLANQILFEAFADRMIRQFPDRKWDIEQVRRQLHVSAATSELAGQRLLVSELALLQLWDILRAENIKLLYKQS